MKLVQTVKSLTFVGIMVCSIALSAETGDKSLTHLAKQPATKTEYSIDWNAQTEKTQKEFIKLDLFLEGHGNVVTLFDWVAKTAKAVRNRLSSSKFDSKLVAEKQAAILENRVVILGALDTVFQDPNAQALFNRIAGLPQDDKDAFIELVYKTMPAGSYLPDQSFLTKLIALPKMTREAVAKIVVAHLPTDDHLPIRRTCNELVALVAYINAVRAAVHSAGTKAIKPATASPDAKPVHVE